MYRNSIVCLSNFCRCAIVILLKFYRKSAEILKTFLRLGGTESHMCPSCRWVAAAERRKVAHVSFLVGGSRRPGCEKPWVHVSLPVGRSLLAARWGQRWMGTTDLTTRSTRRSATTTKRQRRDNETTIFGIGSPPHTFAHGQHKPFGYPLT